jgi:hypothetical protein
MKIRAIASSDISPNTLLTRQPYDNGTNRCAPRMFPWGRGGLADPGAIYS